MAQLVSVSTSALVPEIFAVIVVHRQQPMACSSLRTLLAAGAVAPDVRLTVFVADNTPGGQVPDGLPATILYRAYPANPGLAQPYNDALELAAHAGCAWLLTLDQDTDLPLSFVTNAASQALFYADMPSVAAIGPRVVDSGRPISPFRFLGGWLPKVLGNDTAGILPRHTSAINSASLLRVAALRQLGGYDPAFPLHHSDTRLYQAIDDSGMRVALATGSVVMHELAILDRGARMSPERYRQNLRDECFYWDRHMGAAGRFERLVRLAGRFGRSLLRGEEPAFRNVTLAEMRRRLFTSRRTRLNERRAVSQAADTVGL